MKFSVAAKRTFRIGLREPSSLYLHGDAVYRYSIALLNMDNLYNASSEPVLWPASVPSRSYPKLKIDR